MKERHSEKKMNDSRNTSFFYSLTARASTFLALAVAASFALYVAGNYQEFLDSSQRFLLQWCSILTVMLALFCAAGILMSIPMAIAYRKIRYLIFLLIYLLTLVMSAVLFLLMYGISYLSVGL